MLIGPSIFIKCNTVNHGQIRKKYRREIFYEGISHDSCPDNHINSINGYLFTCVDDFLDRFSHLSLEEGV